MGRKAIDLTGQTFGRWTVLKRDNTIHKDDVYWICECSCDKHTIKSVNGNYLRSGKGKSCGCLNNLDITGQKFNRWTALKYDEKRSTYKTRYWICECSCENHTIRSVSKSDLITGKSLSCGCLQKEVVSDIKGIDLTGQTFGKWTVLGLDDDKSNTVRKYWSVQCSCNKHTIKSIQTGTLRRGESQSCGCIHSPDLTGMKFGKLTVLNKAETKANDGSTMWKCKCDCGNFCNTTTSSLNGNNVKSCGCLVSVMEATAKKYFDSIDLDFIPQYTYEDCVYESKLRFDFYLPDYNYCIEFDGKQHFEPVHFGGISLKEAKKDFKIQQIKDKIKDEYCKTNNIGLIRISYLEFKNYKNILFNKLGIGGEICL